MAMKLGPTSVTRKFDRDWCHVCGVRQKTGFAEIGLVKNAEHAKKNKDDATEEHFLRFCEQCLTALKTYAGDARLGI